MTTESVNDRQVGGSHYRSSYQHWDLVNDVGFDYYEGCATKYLTRRKNNRREDLEKAIHFLEKRDSLSRPGYPRKGASNLDRFARANDLTYAEFAVLANILDQNYNEAIEQIKRIIKGL